MWKYNYSDELYHHGTKNMKWGQRLYQNRDGSLTALGKIRYGNKTNYGKVVSAKKSVARAKKAKAREKAKNRTEAEVIKLRKKSGKTTKESVSKTKPLSEMTNDEIKKANDRRGLENDYNRLHPKQISKGRAITNTIINDMIIPSATDIGKQLVKSKMADIVNTTLGLEGDYRVYANNKKKN